MKVFAGRPYYMSPLPPEVLGNIIAYLTRQTGSEEIAGRLAHHIAVCAECKKVLKHDKRN